MVRLRCVLGFGVVGFFAGLLLVPFGIALLVHLSNRRVPGWWLALIGAAGVLLGLMTTYITRRSVQSR